MTDSVSLAQLAAWCDRHEQVLRWQFEGGALPGEWEAELAELPADTAARAVQRLALLKHLYRARHEAQERSSAPPSPEEAQEAARKLLTREPVRVTLSSGRVVQITGRSYTAMLEIAAHHNRIRLLGEEMEYVGKRFEQARARGRRKAARRWATLYERVATELLRHQERLYAHALTPTGARAGAEEPAPSWWMELAPEDEARILVALLEVGPARYAAMGPPPEHEERGKKGEDWGWAGLLASWGVRTKVEPAAVFDRDLGQVMAEVRTSAPPALEEVGHG